MDSAILYIENGDQTLNPDYRDIAVPAHAYSSDVGKKQVPPKGGT
jgi:hypothetical protein